jgi:hypothetical protein
MNDEEHREDERAPIRSERVKKSARRARSDGAVELPNVDTPEGELFREANAAFEAGNYARVRELTGKLSAVADAQIVDAAADLRRRVSVDPVQIVFLTACLCALLAITYIYILR